MIESYVDDVVRRLPGRQRKDVGLELQALLRDELTGRESDAGRAADEAMTLDVLKGFGAPDAVAERYRDAGPIIIRGADARRFAAWALGGVAVQWPLSFWEMVISPKDDVEFLSRLGHWWVTGGLLAFWWPGVMVTAAIIGAFAGSNGSANETWTPAKRAALDPDRIERGSMAVTMVLYAFAVLFALALPSVLASIPEPVRGYLTPDPRFLSMRAPFALLGWILQFVIYAIAFRQGRWSRLTHRLNLGIEAWWVALLVWFIVGGPMFVAPDAGFDGEVRPGAGGSLLWRRARAQAAPRTDPVAGAAGRLTPRRLCPGCCGGTCSLGNALTGGGLVPDVGLCRCASLRALQFRALPHHHTRYARDSRRREQSRLGIGRTGGAHRLGLAPTNSRAVARKRPHRGQLAEPLKAGFRSGGLGVGSETVRPLVIGG